MPSNSYYSLNDYCRKTFGRKLYKLSLNGGMSCPNRDGTLGSRGCIFCSAGGSGDFAAPASLSITQQIEAARQRVAGKMPHDGKYIAYFQAYTNTYAPARLLRPMFFEAIRHPDIEVLSIATRPDCLPQDVLELLEELARIKPVWVELGLQTIHSRSASYIRRGYDLNCFEEALQHLRERKISVITHVILGLPGETDEDMMATIDYLAHSDIQGIKLQLLHVLRGTDLADAYEAGHVIPLEMDHYLDLVCRCLRRLPSDLVIHRLTGDGPRSLLLAPLWSLDKKKVWNTLQAKIRSENIVQGQDFVP
ncbi:MAG: TIGR01212 family radical SAM protein [Clostridiales bacterium]|nr:TIGR01212 family radical SAM protein [Clostridiales bacterium]